MRQRAVDAAAAEVEAMVQGHPLRRGPGAPLLGSFQSVPPPGQVQAIAPGGAGGHPGRVCGAPRGRGRGWRPAGAHSAQLPIGFSAPPEFNLPARIRGASEALRLALQPIMLTYIKAILFELDMRLPLADAAFAAPLMRVTTNLQDR